MINILPLHSNLSEVGERIYAPAHWFVHWLGSRVHEAYVENYLTEWIENGKTVSTYRGKVHNLANKTKKRRFCDCWLRNFDVLGFCSVRTSSTDAGRALGSGWSKQRDVLDFVL
jgi:hypothetical protein